MAFNIIMTIAIFLAKMCEIALSSIRLIFTVKQQRLIASCIAFCECLIWCIVISGIINSLSQNLYWLLAYCLGYATGVYAGSIIEKKLAIGNIALQFILSLKDKDAVINYLKENGNGYTLVNCQGLKDEKILILTIIKRKDINKVCKKVKELCTEPIFSITSDVNTVYGGFGLKK